MVDDRLIKAAIDSFESDDLLHAKELVQGQVRQARNDFIKAKLGLKNDLENKFVELTPDNYGNDIKAGPDSFDDYKDVVDKTKPKRKLMAKRK